MKGTLHNLPGNFGFDLALDVAFDGPRTISRFVGFSGDERNGAAGYFKGMALRRQALRGFIISKTALPRKRGEAVFVFSRRGILR